MQRLPKEQTLLIYSYWDGYLRDGENQNPDFVEVWKMFPNKQQLHTSGHASTNFLAQVCQAANPTAAIIPIHSQQSDDFKGTEISDELKEKVITASDSKQNIEIVIKKQGLSQSHHFFPR
ncbi:MAG: hypothetical protein FWD56_06200 [Bacteroidales bacterium]|nr:hypothetical protein [Bacteroidales bacterium]